MPVISLATHRVYAQGFPPVEEAYEEPNGLLAVGGDLAPERLLSAYRSGIFPWFNEGEPICWWSPDPRCVFWVDDYKPQRSLLKKIRQQQFQFTVDRCFTEVMRACAAPRSYSNGTWIQDVFVENYSKLHQQGIAHSVEVWSPLGELVGGLYGLNIGQLFFGESMFSRQTDASKAAFAYLMQLCRQWEIPLVDGQVENDHLMNLGAITIPRKAFIHWLEKCRDLPAPNWQTAEAFRA